MVDEERRLPISCLAWGLAILVLTLWPAFDVKVAGHFSLSTTPLEFGANILLFVPLFATLAAYTNAWSRPLLLALVGSVCIEAAQLVLPGRQASPFDVIANVAGAAFGLSAARALRRFLPDRTRRQTAGVAVLAVASLMMPVMDGWAARFLPTVPPFYLQVTPTLTWLPHTNARVLSYDIGGRHSISEQLRPADVALAQSPCFGGMVAPTIIMSQQTSRAWAPILRVSDEAGETLSLLAVWNDALLVTMHTRAESLGAGFVWYAISPALAFGDTVHVRVVCTDGVMAWQGTDGKRRWQGQSDMRYGHLIRAFSGSLLSPIDTRLLLLPLIALFTVAGLLGGVWCTRLMRGASKSRQQLLIGLMALIPGTSALILARADARMAAGAWWLAFVLSVLFSILHAPNVARDQRTAD